jgi:hypothetical protein
MDRDTPGMKLMMTYIWLVITVCFNKIILLKLCPSAFLSTYMTSELSTKRFSLAYYRNSKYVSLTDTIHRKLYAVLGSYQGHNNKMGFNAALY